MRTSMTTLEGVLTQAIVGALYTAPSAGQPPLGFTQALVTLGQGNLPSNLLKNVTMNLTGSSSVSNAGPDNLKLKVAEAKGQFSGIFVHPATGKPVKFTGMILQPQDFASGHLNGTNETGFVTIEPSP